MFFEGGSIIKKKVLYISILIIAVMFIIINIIYRKPEYFQKSITFCSLDGEVVDVQIDIQWHKYFLKGTELHGKLLFGETEYLARRDKYSSRSISEPNLLHKIKDKFNGRHDDLFFYHSELQYPFPDQIWGLFYSELNVYQLHYSPVYSKSKESKRYFGPASTKEEAYEIALEHFGVN